MDIGAGRRRRREAWVAEACRNSSGAWLSMKSVVLATWWRSDIEGCCALQLWTTCCQGNRIHPKHMVAGQEDLGVEGGARSPQVKASCTEWLSHHTNSHSQWTHLLAQHLTPNAPFPMSLFSVLSPPLGKRGNYIRLQLCRHKPRNWPQDSGVWELQQLETIGS